MGRVPLDQGSDEMGYGTWEGSMNGNHTRRKEMEVLAQRYPYILIHSNKLDPIRASESPVTPRRNNNSMRAYDIIL